MISVNKSGLKVGAALNSKTYETGIKVTDERMANLNRSKNDFHGEWNDQISPKSTLKPKSDQKAMAGEG